MFTFLNILQKKNNQLLLEHYADKKTQGYCLNNRRLKLHIYLFYELNHYLSV